jgi:hypothetical protein
MMNLLSLYHFRKQESYRLKNIRPSGVKERRDSLFHFVALSCQRGRHIDIERRIAGLRGESLISASRRLENATTV